MIINIHSYRLILKSILNSYGLILIIHKIIPNDYVFNHFNDQAKLKFCTRSKYSIVSFNISIEV